MFLVQPTNELAAIGLQIARIMAGMLRIFHGEFMPTVELGERNDGKINFPLLNI